MSFDKKAIMQLFTLLNEELSKENFVGELYLVGGAVMCLVFNARPATKDVDSYFQPSTQIRKAAEKVAQKASVSSDWLNDGVKTYLSSKGEFAPYLELSHLRIFTANPDYLLAMKCLAMRIGEEFHDLEDIRYLLRYLNITKREQAHSLLAKYYPLDKFPQKTLYALEELLET